MKSIWAFLGRVLVSVVFLFSGIGKILNWGPTVQAFEGALTHLEKSVSSLGWLQLAVSWAIPSTALILVVVVVFELLGGLLLLLGVKEKLGAVLLVMVILPTTFLFHSFWQAKPLDRELQSILFFKSLSILGALFLILGQGGSKSSGKE